MNIKPIKNKKDYQTALKEIEKLWNSKPNTPQGDKLDVLTTLVESYEAKNYHILPPDPIEAIKWLVTMNCLFLRNLTISLDFLAVKYYNL